jgi:predicted small secreted protein
MYWVGRLSTVLLQGDNTIMMKEALIGTGIALCAVGATYAYMRHVRKMSNKEIMDACKDAPSDVKDAIMKLINKDKTN